MSSSYMTSNTMIDWPQAEAIFGENDPMMRQIYDDFLVSQPDAIRSLVSCISEGAEAGEIREAAHRIKGGVLNFGMQGVAETLEEIERLAFDEQYDGMPEIASSLEPVFTASAMLIEKRYPRSAF